MSNDTVTIWNGVPQIIKSPEVGDLLIGAGLNTFTLGGGANNNTAISQPVIGGDNMEVTTVGGVTRYGFAGYHGAFESHVTQTLNPQGAPVAGTETLVTFGTTTLSYGVTVVSPANTRIKVDNPGVYNIQFSIQILPASANKSAFFWLKYNGNSVAYSNTEVDLTNNNRSYVAAWNFLYAMNANDYLELAWTSDDSGTVLRDGAATYGPNIPSAIATMTLVR